MAMFNFSDFGKFKKELQLTHPFSHALTLVTDGLPTLKIADELRNSQSIFLFLFSF